MFVRGPLEIVALLAGLAILVGLFRLRWRLISRD
jgi:hypothetical protein